MFITVVEHKLYLLKKWSHQCSYSHEGTGCTNHDVLLKHKPYVWRMIVVCYPEINQLSLVSN